MATSAFAPAASDASTASSRTEAGTERTTSSGGLGKVGQRRVRLAAEDLAAARG